MPVEISDLEIQAVAACLNRLRSGNLATARVDLSYLWLVGLIDQDDRTGYVRLCQLSPEELRSRLERAERRSENLLNLQSRLAEKEEQISRLRGTVTRRNREIADMRQLIAERRTAAALDRDVEEFDMVDTRGEIVRTSRSTLRARSREEDEAVNHRRDVSYIDLATGELEHETLDAWGLPRPRPSYEKKNTKRATAKHKECEGYSPKPVVKPGAKRRFITKSKRKGHVIDE